MALKKQVGNSALIPWGDSMISSAYYVLEGLLASIFLCLYSLDCFLMYRVPKNTVLFIAACLLQGGPTELPMGLSGSDRPRCNPGRGGEGEAAAANSSLGCRRL